VDSLWVFILLLASLGTIVAVRLFFNGAQEDSAATFEALSPAETWAAATSAEVGPAAGPPATTAAAASTPPAPSPLAIWPGGDCPRCGYPTTPFANFCGECGNRLVNG